MEIFFAVIKQDGEVIEVRGPMLEDDVVHVETSLPDEQGYEVEIGSIELKMRQ